MIDSKTRRAAFALAARVQAAVANANTFAEWAPLVIEACRGCGYDAWITYDDAGGNAHSWAKQDFHKVRQVRNHPLVHVQLFDAIQQKPARRKAA